MRLEKILFDGREAQELLSAKGYNVEAESVRRLIISRSSSATLNRTLHTDLARVRALLRRAHDAMSRREPDGVSTAEWDQLLADMAKELGVQHG